MPRIDRSDVNTNLVTPPITTARKNENSLINAETNTDPWQPPCQSCLQRKNSQPQFVFENNTIDMNEYVKAINYINAIHNLINESLLTKSGQGVQRNSPLNLKANISMPDLPNFLSLLTGINNFTNAKASGSQMVSRTTSTSTLSTPHTIINKPDEEIEEIEEKCCCVKCKEYANTEAEFQDHESKHLLNTNSEEFKGYGDQIPETAIEEVSEYGLCRDLDPENFAEPIKPEPYYVLQDHECSCEHCSSSNNKRTVEKNDIANNTKEKIPSQHAMESEQFYKQVVKQQQQQQNIELQRKKGVPEISSNYRIATKTKDCCNCEKREVSDGSRRRLYESVLSDAEIDKYASELLVGLDWESCDNSVKSGETTFTFVVPVTRHMVTEKAKQAKCQSLSQSSPESVKRKPVSKSKETPLQVKQKSVTQIPVKQNQQSSSAANRRSNSRSCSPVKTRMSSSVRPGSATISNKRHIKTEAIVQNHSNDSCTTIHSEKQESIKTFRPVSSTKPKSFQLPSLTALEKAKIAPKQHSNSHASTASPVQQNHHMVFSTQKKPPQHDCNMKKGATYKVQQKEYDDFICSRKTVKTQLLRKSSESIVSSDKDQEIVICTDNVVIPHDSKEISDVHTKTYKFPCKGSHNNTESSSKKSSRNDIEDALHQMQISDERFVVSVPPKKRKDVRNKPFRQARRQSGDREDIFHIRNYITPSKHTNESDSNSNDSSDIKSDKETNFKKPQSAVSIVNNNNNVGRSREHMRHRM